MTASTISAGADVPRIFHVDRLNLRLTPKAWRYADERRPAIDEFFARQVRLKPSLWTGRVLILHHYTVADGVFEGDYLETDYASLSAWCSWGREVAGVSDCFGAAPLLSADGAFLLGRMGSHTFNAGQIYFVSGTPDRSDILDGTVDMAFNIRRELKEETGLDIAEFSEEPGWTTVIDGSLIAHMKVLRSKKDAEILRARILSELRREAEPELSDIVIVRSLSDINDAMPRYVRAFLSHRFGRE